MRSFALKTLCSVAFLILLVLPKSVFADTLFISPSTGDYAHGQTFSVRIRVSSPQQSINAISSVLSFPTDKLQVISLSKTNSILSLWVQEPTFSNTAGTVSLEGVVPNPGFIGSDGQVIVINFKAVGAGYANVKLSSGSLLANDGLGTNVLRTLGSASFNIGNGQIETPAVAEPLDIIVRSSTHPDPTKWYPLKNASFEWNLPAGATETRLSLSKLPNAVPTVKYSPAISNKYIPDNTDGVWYLHVQTKNGANLSKITHFRFNVDTSSPDSFSIRQIPDSDLSNPQPRFMFVATDAVSGINHYAVSIDKAEEVIWRPDSSDIYTTPVLGPGRHAILARAVDEAGNATPASIDFNITGIEPPKITYYTEAVDANSPVVVKGTAPKGVTVRIFLVKGSEKPFTADVGVDETGAFSTAIESNSIEQGVYKLYAVSIDDRGARSEPSSSKTVLVRIGWLESLGSWTIKILIAVITIAALWFALTHLTLRSLRGVRRLRSEMRKDLHNIDRLAGKSFELLKEDVTDSIRILEHAKTKRQLTAEEDAIVRRLRQNLADAEKIIHKEVLDAEKDLGD